jgi:hypothetical protein
MATLEYLTAGEAKIARRLVKSILARGLTVSVYDGEETTLARSKDRAAILAAMGTTGCDTLTARNDSGARVASFMLVYGNAEDGSELIADHSAGDTALDIYDSLGLE